jgi:hypothetical protein
VSSASFKKTSSGYVEIAVLEIFINKLVILRLCQQFSDKTFFGINKKEN